MVEPERRASWVSRGLESLLCDLPSRRKLAPAQPDFDILIIGSGYGGAVAADRLAGVRDAHGRPQRVAVLERGREHLAGSFPDRAAEVPGHVRFTTPQGDGARGQLEGLFDLRIGGDISVLLANGVGGGSLINAGVMESPRFAVFSEKQWPAALKGQGAALVERAQRLLPELGASGQDMVRPGLKRFQAMQTLKARTVPITVALSGGQRSVGNVELKPCIECGDCATGCNHGAKVSLDLGLLRRAQERGVEIFAGATVSRLQPGESGWVVDVWHTDSTLRARMARAAKITAHRVILAAGALGSTEILMRSMSPELRLSSRLGRGFSGNGDVLAAVIAADSEFNSVADETVRPDQRHVGPTITAMIDCRGAAGDGFVVQDLGVPGALVRLFEEGITTSRLFQQLDQPDSNNHVAYDHPNAAQLPDPMAVDPKQMRRALAVALICRDDAAGQMTALPDDMAAPRDAGLRIDWPQLRNDGRIQKAHEGLQDLLHKGDQVLPNPVWRLLPPAVEEMLGARRGPLLSVHPLGGCGMGDDRRTGVVDADGQVFDANPLLDPRTTHPGLVVLDGAIVPGSLGINPALTIATLADRAIERLIDTHWDLQRPATLPNPAPTTRPVFSAKVHPGPPVTTKVQVIERLAGWVDIEGAPALWMELDLVYETRELFPAPGGQRTGFTQQGHVLPVALDTQLSRVRLFPSEGSAFEDQRPDNEALFVAPLAEGSQLRFLHREASTPKERRCRAIKAWFWNRGLRDSTLAVIDALFRRSREPIRLCERLRQSKALATRAGEVRLFDYDLILGPPTRAMGYFEPLQAGPARSLRGSKRFTYERRANPWTQLMRMTLHEFAGLPLGAQRELTVSPAYFARKGMPLLRVVDQENQPAALIDVLAFLLYVVRVFVNVHLWSGRKPDDRWRPREPRRLPGPLPSVAEPQIFEIAPAGAAAGHIRLTRYPRPNSGRPPVLLIHGYSASGTTFAHPALRPSLAKHLWDQGLEPWVLDLRTSCGMPTADQPFTFEEIARTDIPVAVREVCARTGAAQIDIVSHCMGSAMLAMTLRDQRSPVAGATAARMRRWVMSQFGPLMRFSPANVLRAYLMSWFRHLVPDYRYSLAPGGDAPGVDGALYDRMVAMLPYLNDRLGCEFDIENPFWPPWRRTAWTGTRHRLDALIGRTFDARRMDPAVLDCIDDFFGPLNLATMSQPIYFAKFGEPTERSGLDVFGEDPAPLLADIPMLSLHGGTNGLADPETEDLLKAWTGSMPGVKLQLQTRKFDDRGHQDLLIGRDNAEVFDAITSFLAKP